MILTTAAACLAANIYWESRGEPIPGQYAVAYVTMERAGYNKRKVCDVVMEPKQFSWTKHGVYKTANGYVVTRAIKEPEAWIKAQKIAYIAVQGSNYNWLGQVKYFHSTQVSPMWRYSMVEIKRIGNHVFYSDSKSVVRGQDHEIWNR